LRFNGFVVLPARDREALEQAVVRGSELLKQGKLDQAQRAFRAALEIDPDSPRVLALLGLAHFRANEFSDARGLYEQLVERAPTDASHRLNLGLVYLKLNDAERAIAALEASRALDPSQGRAVSYLGLAYARGGRYAEAYRAFLIAGQNELAVEIESNLAAAERDRIHGQLGRTPNGPLPVGAPTPYSAVPAAQRAAMPASIPRTPSPSSAPRTPTPPGVPRVHTPEPDSAASEPPSRGQAPAPAEHLSNARTPTPPGGVSVEIMSRARTPTPPGGVPETGSRPHALTDAPPIGQRTLTPTGVPRTPTPHVVPRTPTPLPGSAVLMTGHAPVAAPRTPTPPGVPRTRPPTAPPGKRRSQELPTAAPAEPSSGVASVHDVHGKIHIDIAAATGGVPAPTPDAPERASDSMQFVMPRGEPAAPQEPLDGPSMISRAVASATALAAVGSRTKAGGTPPRPLSELATDQLIRPDEGDDAFEIGANGALIVRVAERVMTRLDGVCVTGGDLTYEHAMRRSRGHSTDEAFDYGGSQLHAVSGRGYLIAVPGEHAFSAVLLDDDILYLREDLVFAFQAQLRWENGNVPGLRGRLPVVQFRGNGALAMRLRRPLVRVKLPPQGMVFIDADRLAGWIGRVIPRAVVPPPGGPLGAMCVECTGEGVVLVEDTPREMTDVPRITAKWPRVTVEPFLMAPQITPSPPSPDRDAPGDPLADATDTARTTAEPSRAAEAPEVIDDRDRLDDL
jgi:hypothetical protein